MCVNQFKPAQMTHVKVISFIYVETKQHKNRLDRHKRMFLSAAAAVCVWVCAAQTSFFLSILDDISHHLRFNRALHMKMTVPSLNFNINSFYRHIIIKWIHKRYQMTHTHTCTYCNRRPKIQIQQLQSEQNSMTKETFVNFFTILII